MLKLFANFVDHPLTRVVSSLIGLAAITFLMLFCVVISLSPKTNWMLAVAAGGLVGLVGWWLRVINSLSTLATYPFLRWIICGSLAIGITSFTYTLLTWHHANEWRPFLYPIGLTGLLLFVGSLAAPSKAAHRDSGTLA